MDVVFIAPTRDINELRGVDDFIKAWDAPAPLFDQLLRLHPQPRQKRSPLGNINIDGKSWPAESRMNCRNHPHFLEEIEPGVRDLVEVLTMRHRLVTYTSCEGHFYLDQNKYDERHVGILLRSREQRDAIIKALRNAPLDVYETCEDNIYVGIVDHQVSNGDNTIDALDIAFMPNPGVSAKDYFFHLPRLYEPVTRWLNDAEPLFPEV